MDFKRKLLLFGAFVCFVLLAGWTTYVEISYSLVEQHLPLPTPSTYTTIHDTCYILHKTHKLNKELTMNRFKRAQSQVHGYKSCQYILLYWIGDNNQTDLSWQQHQNLTWTKKHIGDDNIFIVDHTKTNYVFNDIFIEFKNSGYYWLTRRWEWNMADIPEMVWAYYKFIDNETKNVKLVISYENIYIWVMEYDVVWSGHLGKILIDGILLHSDDAYSSYNVRVKTNTTWPHLNKVYPSKNTVFNTSNPVIYSTLIQLIRYKPELLFLMIQQIQRKHYVYCEMRAIQLCLFFANGSCTYTNFVDDFGKYFGYFSHGQPNKKLKTKINAEIAENMTNKLFHPIK